ncbi:MAG: hypothetical protein IH926_08820 [Proteobacteria bacterium]|nr:hypothetical protein [Pseudomonadota bacterium]
MISLERRLRDLTTISEINLKIDGLTDPPWDFQTHDIAWMLAQKAGIVGSEVGTGKTMLAIGAALSGEELTEREMPYLDEYAALDVHSADEVREAFRNGFYFGCEADDPTTTWAFNGQPRLNAMFSSDVGHWDVRDMRECVAEAYEGVESGLMDARDFREFVFANPARLHAGMNPDFFKGTAVEAEVEALLGDGNR